MGEGREAPKYGDNDWQGSPEIQRKRPLGVDNRIGLGNRGKEELFPAAAFVYIEVDANTAFVEGIVEADKWGFITTSRTKETSLEGVFAASDARGVSTKQTGG